MRKTDLLKKAYRKIAHRSQSINDLKPVLSLDDYKTIDANDHRRLSDIIKFTENQKLKIERNDSILRTSYPSHQRQRYVKLLNYLGYFEASNLLRASLVEDIIYKLENKKLFSNFTSAEELTALISVEKVIEAPVLQKLKKKVSFSTTFIT